MIDIQGLKKVHFIGITSAFCSFCANYLIEKGVKVTASEVNQQSEDAKKWIERGVLYEGGHSGKYITDDLDLVVLPTGPIPGNPECVVAERKNIPTIPVAKLTGIISKEFKTIAIAGTHGKTTTCALTVWMLYKALGSLPNFVIGDHILDIDRSWNYNPENEYFVVEACEYKKQFLDRAPTPYISVITNIELDHTDFFKSQEQYNDAFVEFVSNTTKALVVDTKGNNIENILRKIKEYNIEIVDVANLKDDCSNVTAGLRGDYNKQNVLRACGVAEYLKLNVDIEDFPGVASRFEFKGSTINGMSVYLDYAHNPTKVKACLRATRESFPDKKIIFVWQPHSFERTYSFKDQFAKSLDDTDILYIPNIFAPNREERRYKELITEEEFVDYLKEKNPSKEILYTKDFENTASLLLDKKYNSDYICVLASAGDLYKILPSLKLEDNKDEI
jgi:UDP-N-acetylmuramate--alanine ligase